MREIDWQAFARIFDDFNRGIAAKTYSVFSEPEFAELWRAAGAEQTDFQESAPGAPTYYACIEKR